MNPAILRALSFFCLAYGVLFYLLGVTGALWTKTPPADVGLLSVSVLFVLFGVAGLQLKHGPVRQ